MQEKFRSEDLTSEYKSSKSSVEEAKEEKEKYEKLPWIKGLLYLSEKKYAKRNLGWAEERYGKAVKNVEEHMPEIEEEAYDYLEAIKVYESEAEKLGKELGIKPPLVKTGHLFYELGASVNRYFYDYKNDEKNKNLSEEAMKEKTKELFLEAGKILAIKDIITPQVYALNGGPDENESVSPCVIVEGRSFRVKETEDRLPNPEVGKSLAGAVKEAKEKGLKNIVEISSTLNGSDGNGNRVEKGTIRRKKYIVLGDEYVSFIANNTLGEKISGYTLLYPTYIEKFYGIRQTAGSVEFEVNAVPVEEFEGKIPTEEIESENTQEIVSIVLKYDMENIFSHKQEHKETKLKGSIKELRQAVLDMVISMEFGGGNESIVVNNTFIKVDGKDVSFDEFTREPIKETK